MEDDENNFNVFKFQHGWICITKKEEEASVRGECVCTICGIEKPKIARFYN